MSLARRSPSEQPLAVLATTLATSLALCLPAAGPASAGDTPPGVWPLQPQPEIVHGFDPPDVRWGSGHRGVDLAGRVGQPVRAALAGTVTFAGRVAGRGVVVVDHGGSRTTYQPVTASVSRGEVLTRGQVIGTLAWYGTHCSPAACLHWGLVAGSTYLDPLSLVGAPHPVRLLPLDGAPTDPTAFTGATSEVPQGSGPVDLPGPALVALAGAVVGTGAA